MIGAQEEPKRIDLITYLTMFLGTAGIALGLVARAVGVESILGFSPVVVFAVPVVYVMMAWAFVEQYRGNLHA